MKKFLSNYKSTIILVVAIIVGCIIGIVFQEKATILQPLGDIFLNLLLVIIVPLIFLTITTSIAKMKSPKRLGKIMITIIGVFIVTSIIAVLVGMASTYATKLVNVEDGEKIKASLEQVDEVKDETEEKDEEPTIAERTVSLLTVNDFRELFSKNNIIALLVFSVITGIAINLTCSKAKPFLDVLISANEVIQKIIKIIMYYAPIGLGCYVASLVGSFGSSIAVGYLKTFLVYTLVALVYYFIFYSIYALFAGGKKGLKIFWKNIIPQTFTSLATCSSVASIPVNVENTVKMGVPEDIAETTIPMGSSFHKEGSVIGSVFKIMFLVCLFGMQMNTPGAIFTVLGVALLATLLITGVPIGGGTISEMLIITLMGFPIQALPILTVIATIIDPPATMLNVVGDSASSMMVTRLVDGKNWIKEKKK